MKNFQDLPDELVLKILSYSETKDLIRCGQVSKRTRRISHDSTLWVSANFEKEIVKTELLEIVFEKGCRILRLHNSTIIGSLSSNLRPQLRILNFSQPVTDGENSKVLEELLYSCCSLQSLEMEGVLLTPKMVESIWYKNRKTLQRLNLNFANVHVFVDGSSYPFTIPHYLQEIIERCQDLKEVDLAYMNNTRGQKMTILNFLSKIFHQMLKS